MRPRPRLKQIFVEHKPCLFIYRGLSIGLSRKMLTIYAGCFYQTPQSSHWSCHILWWVQPGHAVHKWSNTITIKFHCSPTELLAKMLNRLLVHSLTVQKDGNRGSGNASKYNAYISHVLASAHCTQKCMHPAKITVALINNRRFKKCTSCRFSDYNEEFHGLI